MGNIDFRWDGPDLPGVPLLAIVLTTRGIAPVYAPALELIDEEDGAAAAREVADALHRFADHLTEAVDLVAAVESAFAPDTPGADGAS